MSFEAWLGSRYAAATAREYRRLVGRWLAAVGAVHAATAGYNDVASWLGAVRHTHTVEVCLHALRAYYRYLIERGLRADDPTSALHLRRSGCRRVPLPHLLPARELRLLRAGSRELSPREGVIMDFLSYSALLSREIASLEVRDVDLSRGTLCVAAGRRTAGRTILLAGQQVLQLRAYLRESRPLLNTGGLDALVITRQGNGERADNIAALVRRLRWLLPERCLTPLLIRQSVIAMMLAAGRDVRAVQLFAGHRHPGSTERYRFTGLEELKAAVKKHHPLD